MRVGGSGAKLESFEYREWVVVQTFFEVTQKGEEQSCNLPGLWLRNGWFGFACKLRN